MDKKPSAGATLVVCAALWGVATSAAPVPHRPGAPGHAAQAALADPFDGATFAGDSGPKGKPADEPDELTFHGGRFRSKACNRYGFGEAPYKVAKSAASVSFEAVAHSDKEGAMAWKGTLRGTTLEGTVVWTKTGQPAYEYWFKTTRR